VRKRHGISLTYRPPVPPWSEGLEALCDPFAMDYPTPRQAGRSPEPPRVRSRDRALVEWVADAAPGDRIPEPWKWARSPTRSVILTLVDLGVIAHPEPGTDLSVVVSDASAAARSWLGAHPADG
jgi:hypothetical protein